MSGAAPLSLPCGPVLYRSLQRRACPGTLPSEGRQICRPRPSPDLLTDTAMIRLPRQPVATGRRFCRPAAAVRDGGLLRLTLSPSVGYHIGQRGFVRFPLCPAARLNLGHADPAHMPSREVQG